MEEEVKISCKESGGDSSKDVTSENDMSNNVPAIKGKDRPQGEKSLKDVDSDQVPEISNGVSNLPKKGRGRPRRKTEEKSSEGSGQNNQENVNSSEGNLQKKSPSTAEDVANGSSVPKAGRGRPKGSLKRKSISVTQDEDGSSSQPIKRGRPKGSPNKTPRLMAELGTNLKVQPGEGANLVTSSRGRVRKTRVPYSGTQHEQNKTPQKNPRGRGRPRKILKAIDASVKRGRGRPKGSSKKTSEAQVRVPAKKKRVQSKQMAAKRGRPRKHPLPTREELKKPKVWKPLGRPRKYPRADPPEGAQTPARRGRGRPRRSDLKKGAHLHTHSSKAPAPVSSRDRGAPKKRGRPPLSSKNQDVNPRKRGHAKSSPSKNEHKGDCSLANEDEANTSEPRNDSDSVEKNDAGIKA